MKPYDVGLVCGRFQTFHKGHEKLIDTGLLLCDRMLILVGSAQECGTERNPLNVNTRIKMIREVYGDDPNIMIYALSDLTDENDITPDWGRYLLQNVDRYIYKNPDVMSISDIIEFLNLFAIIVVSIYSSLKLRIVPNFTYGNLLFFFENFLI